MICSFIYTRGLHDNVTACFTVRVLLFCFFSAGSWKGSGMVQTPKKSLGNLLSKSATRFVELAIVVEQWGCLSGEVPSGATVNTRLWAWQRDLTSLNRLIRKLLRRAFRGIFEIRSIVAGPVCSFFKSPQKSGHKCPHYTSKAVQVLRSVLVFFRRDAFLACYFGLTVQGSAKIWEHHDHHCHHHHHHPGGNHQFFREVVGCTSAHTTRRRGRRHLLRGTKFAKIRARDERVVFDAPPLTEPYHEPRLRIYSTPTYL